MLNPIEISRDPDKIEQECLGLLDQAMSMEVGLDNGEADYDLNFIASKLKAVTIFMERLSDIQIMLTKYTIVVRQQASNCETIHKIAKEQLHVKPEFRNIPAVDRVVLEREQLGETLTTWERWRDVAATLTLVNNAVSDRAGTIKRLDSDLRLHSKLYEQRVAQGATSPHSFKGASIEEIDVT